MIWLMRSYEIGIRGIDRFAIVQTDPHARTDAHEVVSNDDFGSSRRDG